MKDVDYDLEIIEHNPLAGWKAIDRSGVNPFVLAKSRLHLGSDGFEVRLGRTGANDKEIGECGDATQVEDDNIFGLFIGGQFCAKSG